MYSVTVSHWLCAFVLRIQRSGGFVTWNSVGVANVNGRLAMTRSIGDFHLKGSGVIAEPDTRRLTVSFTGRFVGSYQKTWGSTLLPLLLWKILSELLCVSAGPARQRLLPGSDHRRHQLPAEQPGDLWCHQPVSGPHRGCWRHRWAGTRVTSQVSIQIPQNLTEFSGNQQEKKKKHKAHFHSPLLCEC